MVQEAMELLVVTQVPMVVPEVLVATAAEQQVFV
tara:strand:- start:14 stop:115 length:102 start_codon:yes stop_codon:yes gene_type:complete